MASEDKQQQQQQQERQQWLREITQDTEEQNPRLQVLADGTLAIVDRYGKPKPLDWNDSKHKLIVRLECGAGFAGDQHYR
jgi:hypothetical protein